MFGRFVVACVVGILVYWAGSMLLPLAPISANAKTVIWVLGCVIGGITLLFFVFGSWTPSWWKWGGPPS